MYKHQIQVIMNITKKTRNVSRMPHAAAGLLIAGAFIAAMSAAPSIAQAQDAGASDSQPTRETIEREIIVRTPGQGRSGGQGRAGEYGRPERGPSQGKGMGPGMRPGMQDDQHLSGLTDEQRARIRDIQLNARKRMLPVDNQLNEKRARLQTLSTGETIDRNAAKKVIREISDLQAERMTIRWETRQEVRSVLTDEQKIRFDSRGAGRKGAGGRVGPGGMHMGPEGRGRHPQGARSYQGGGNPQGGRPMQGARHPQGGSR
jgi:Spy/CpxP family protein refolding chaperone